MSTVVVIWEMSYLNEENQNYTFKYVKKIYYQIISIPSTSTICYNPIKFTI